MADPDAGREEGEVLPPDRLPERHSTRRKSHARVHRRPWQMGASQTWSVFFKTLVFLFEQACLNQMLSRFILANWIRYTTSMLTLASNNYITTLPIFRVKKVIS